MGAIKQLAAVSISPAPGSVRAGRDEFARRDASFRRDERSIRLDVPARGVNFRH